MQIKKLDGSGNSSEVSTKVDELIEVLNSFEADAPESIDFTDRLSHMGKFVDRINEEQGRLVEANAALTVQVSKLTADQMDLLKTIMELQNKVLALTPNAPRA